MRRAERRSEARGGARDKIVALAGQRSGEGAGDGEALPRLVQLDRVTVRDEGEQGFEFVIAIGPPPPDMQGEVQFGRCRLGKDQFAAIRWSWPPARAAERRVSRPPVQRPTFSLRKLGASPLRPSASLPAIRACCSPSA